MNSAADYFVRRIPDWRSHVEVLRQGARGRIFRPTPTLFLLLKVGRLSEVDLEDCLAVLRHARQEVDAALVLSALTERPDDGPRTRRAAALRTALTSNG